MRLFICALWSPVGKGLTSWLSFVVSNCEFVTFPCGILGQVWYLIVSILDHSTLTYFVVTCWERAELLALLYLMFSCVLSLSHVVSCVRRVA